MQVKDPSKATHAADEDLKELVEFRGLEMKKDPWTEAKCSPERFEKVKLKCAFCHCTPSMASSQLRWQGNIGGSFVDCRLQARFIQAVTAWVLVSTGVGQLQVWTSSY